MNIQPTGQPEDEEPRCTCGAMELEGCACEITPRQFFATLAERAARRQARSRQA